ncbi:MAG: methyltransferase domain-containing protein [Acetobacteraceae bacterium]|jgi:SAM-dependent methyltransferase
MGEIFRRETAEHPEPFTGERLTTAIGGQIEIEHYHRYLFARALVPGLDVLDVASGEGYGSALLAQVARSVVGVEYSGPTVQGAVGNFVRANLRYLRADARALPLADACVDAVVSFGTIEHFGRQDDFLREVRRVLRPDGRFIVSTPDRDVYSPAGSAANPFHVHELSRLEFAALLRGTFRHVQVMQQRALIGSALLAEAGSTAPPLVFDRRGEAHFEACIGLPRAPYLIAVASDREPPPLPPSLYIDRGDVGSEQTRIVELADRLQETEFKRSRVQADLSEVQAELSQVRVELARMQAELSKATENHRRVRAEFTEVTDDLRETSQRADRSEQARRASEDRNEALRRERDLVQRQFGLMQGSLRTFMRGYLPRLRRRLRRQRP